MKILIGLGHPAHFHLFKNSIKILSQKGILFKIVISEKDILRDLLDSIGVEYQVITKNDRKKTFFSKVLALFNSTSRLNKIVKKENPDLLIGCLSQIAFSGFINRKPVIFFGEDDFRYTYLQGIVVLPFVNKVIAPSSSNLGPFEYKKIAYDGYQKLAYLHPLFFTPDYEIIKKHIPENEKYFLIRLVNLNAYHDTDIQGIDDKLVLKLINKLNPYGKVYITSERELPPSLTQYRLSINIPDIHHFMYYATLYIGDSQSMAVEAAMLGTPSIRYNDFAGRVSILEELEKKYCLTFGIKTSDQDKLFDKINALLLIPDLKAEFQKRRKKMLADKIDVTAFMVWFIENYPQSNRIMKENPAYQYNFK